MGSVPGSQLLQDVLWPPADAVPAVQFSQSRSWPGAVVIFCPARHSTQALGACLPVLGHVMTFVFSMNRFAVGSYTPASCHEPLMRLPNAIGSIRWARSSKTTCNGVEFSATLSFSVLFQTLFSSVWAITRGLKASPRHSLMT